MAAFGFSTPPASPEFHSCVAYCVARSEVVAAAPRIGPFRGAIYGVPTGGRWHGQCSNKRSMKPSRCFGVFAFLLVLCLGRFSAVAAPHIIISVPDQRLVVMENGVLVGHYPVSTSKFGLGDTPSSYATPLGMLEVAAKIGDGAPLGAVFKGQHFTGEILPPNAPGRDPIVTRILHLRGLEAGNARAFDRGIYIHGTPEEFNIGRPASYGCIRMRSRDVVQVFDEAPVGTKIEIVDVPLRRALAAYAAQQFSQGHHVALN